MTFKKMRIIFILGVSLWLRSYENHQWSIYRSIICIIENNVKNTCNFEKEKPLYSLLIYPLDFVFFPLFLSFSQGVTLAIIIQ